MYIAHNHNSNAFYTTQQHQKQNQQNPFNDNLQSALNPFDSNPQKEAKEVVVAPAFVLPSSSQTYPLTSNVSNEDLSYLKEKIASSALFVQKTQPQEEAISQNAPKASSNANIPTQHGFNVDEEGYFGIEFNQAAGLPDSVRVSASLYEFVTANTSKTLEISENERVQVDVKNKTDGVAFFGAAWKLLSDITKGAIQEESGVLNDAQALNLPAGITLNGSVFGGVQEVFNRVTQEKRDAIEKEQEILHSLGLDSGYINLQAMKQQRNISDIFATFISATSTHKEISYIEMDNKKAGTALTKEEKINAYQAIKDGDLSLEEYFDSIRTKIANGSPDVSLSYQKKVERDALALEALDTLWEADSTREQDIAKNSQIVSKALKENSNATHQRDLLTLRVGLSEKDNPISLIG